MTNIHKAAREALEALNAMLTHMGMDEDEWNKPTFNQARTAIATLRAALSEAPGEERDERAAFEDWIAPTLRNGSHLNRSRVNQVYTDNRVAAKWAAWQARAMLAARPEAMREAAGEIALLRAALEYAIREADEWHDDCRGGPIASTEMDAVRALLGARSAAPPVALTEEQMPAPWPIRAATRIGHISELHDYAHRAIAKFCEVNGLAQPNEASKEGGA